MHADRLGLSGNGGTTEVRSSDDIQDVFDDSGSRGCVPCCRNFHFEAFLFCGTATDHIIPAQCELMDEYAMAAKQE